MSNKKNPKKDKINSSDNKFYFDEETGEFFDEEFDDFDIMSNWGDEDDLYNDE